MTPLLLRSSCCRALALLLLACHASAFSTPPPSSSSSAAYDAIQRSSTLLDPITGDRPQSPPIASSSSSSGGGGTMERDGRKSLVVILPQLGEFDSSEYVEYLVSAMKSLDDNNVDLRCIGIGDANAAKIFCDYTGLPIDRLLIDPHGDTHRTLGLHAGPDLNVPDAVSDDVLKFILNSLPGGIPDDDMRMRPVATAWLNYLAMCAGIGARGTLSEILRGYFGDRDAPERLRDDDVVNAGFVTIGPGVGPVKIGPFSYVQWFADERGYQRPVELATVRLRNMVEVLTKWNEYVTDPTAIALRGATYLFDENGRELYSYRSRGVLTYSETMPRPLNFLSPYIGEDVARNPLGLRDDGGGGLVRGRGALKPLGKAMEALSFVFKLEAKLQAMLLGADDDDRAAARKDIERAISNDEIVVYTYRLSPFSGETLAVLDEVGAKYTNIVVGDEWFLLNKERSVMRSELLELTGQSSLPHVFIGGRHMGGLFTGSSDGKYPGLAGLKESGELMEIVKTVEVSRKGLVNSS